MTFYAHTKENDSNPDHWQKLIDHLTQTARFARDFAEAFNARDFGYLAGLWHDVGKYSKAFQDMLLATADTEAHIETRSHVDHSTAGAILAWRQFKDIGKIMAYAIAGHHAGLTDGQAKDEGDRSSLEYRLKEEKVIQAIERVISEIPRAEAIPKFPFRPEPKRFTFELSFFIRMLYSTLVDADFLDTERFMDEERFQQRQGYPTLAELEPRLSAYLKTLNEKNNNSPVNPQRRYVQQQCLNAVEKVPGLFSLTVPTGGGKTLSSLAFAMKHAIKYGFKRIIYVIPFTSIIEQNADVFRRVLGDDAVLEHHSNYEPSEEDHRTRLACENWDAPIIVTTNVQFFESLFANRSSRCRKLHNIARSVVILDEAQTLPACYLKPCLETLRELSVHYQTSIVLCTATQPAIQYRDEFKSGLTGVREIIDKPTELFEKLKRVDVQPPLTLSDDELAVKITEHQQVLCIVNTRRHAQTLYEMVKSSGDAYHLSALMCPAHRSKRLAEIRQRLKDGLPCRVISSQVVEAGVDIDFPVVYRSLAGLDSIAQAAGRCNREGKLDSGKVYIFKPVEPIRAGFFRQTAQTAEEVIRRYPRDILGLKAVEEYFKTYYWSQGEERLDEKNILTQLKTGEKTGWFPFRTISESFQFIENNTRPIIIPWDEDAKKLIDQIRYSDSPGRFIRKLQKYTVSIHPFVWQKMVNAGAIEVLKEQFPVLISSDLYRKDIGLYTDDPEHHDVETLFVC
jgi:CRISPR-associated endonuclease/helicase Cas3